MDIENNDNFNKVIDLINTTSEPIFITGNAGTGKSTLLKYFKKITEKNVALLAPTGVAALNLEGQTIHSFFKFKADITLSTVVKHRNGRLYRNLDIIIIDEISMVRADLLDCIDKALRLHKNPEQLFGGIQMIFVGDLHQLPPIVPSHEEIFFKQFYKTPYFFSAFCLQDYKVNCIELKNFYRQKDIEFINLLNKIRGGTIHSKDLERLNKQIFKKVDPHKQYVYLATRNKVADQINEKELYKINEPLYTFDAKISGKFGKENFPTAPSLRLKKGAQIMMVYNDPSKRWVNGTMGVIEDIDDNRHNKAIAVNLNNEIYFIKPNKWDICKFFLDGQKVCTETIGSFEQYPLMLAWAITIHKSQGKTFDNAVIDFSSGVFAPGQVYVALSRCKTLEGIILKKRIDPDDIWVDPDVVKFLCSLK